MKVRPILFSDPMVRAILEGRKTQTRRVVQPSYNQEGRITNIQEWREQNGRWFGLHGYMTAAHCACPYGQPGDRLYVREAWAVNPYTPEVRYRATDELWTDCGPLGWRPSIHMPKDYSRILLEIVAVRCERLNYISPEDAGAEGLCKYHGPENRWNFDGGICHASPIGAYAALWEQINGPGSWAANPWVWAIEFKRVMQ